MPYESKHFKAVMQNPNVPGQNLIIYNPSDDMIYKRRYIALKEMVYELEDENNLIALKVAQARARIELMKNQAIDLAEHTSGIPMSYGISQPHVQPIHDPRQTDYKLPSRAPPPLSEQSRSERADSDTMMDDY